MKALVIAGLLALLALMLVGCDDGRRDILGDDPMAPDERGDHPRIHPPRLDPCIFARGDDERCDDDESGP